ncbi:unnamed protein product [Menidia menidia]|uniref:(Atlantic silverside) hypothetical protein n=1 Tax=Menidia menidia TaxID=238744 RepID=A0A8S4AZC4_9TELE|nr:unnamed protein product [Menidia menidia]
MVKSPYLPPFTLSPCFASLTFGPEGPVSPGLPDTREDDTYNNFNDGLNGFSLFGSGVIRSGEVLSVIPPTLEDPALRRNLSDARPRARRGEPVRTAWEGEEGGVHGISLEMMVAPERARAKTLRSKCSIWLFLAGFPARACPAAQVMLVWLFRCLRSTLPSEKAFPHCAHTYGRSPVCTRMWTVTLCAMVKPLPHTAHLKGRSPVCVSRCVRMAPIWEKALPQSGHTCGFSPVWTRVWLRSPPAVEKHCEQCVVAVAEAAAAHGAALGPLVAVPQLVVGQALLRQEALAALRAAVGLLVVHALVVLELADAGEGLLAVAAAEAVAGAVGQLVLAHLVVPQQVGHLEGLPAVRALVLGQQLDALVAHALVRRAELAAALGADVRGVLALALAVGRQVGLGAEGLPALRALVGLDRRVEALVLQELEAVLEAAPAQRAVVRDPPARVHGFDRGLPGGGQGGGAGPDPRGGLPVRSPAQQLGHVRPSGLPVALLVFGQALGGDEALAALLALVGLVVVHLLVVLQVADAREAGAAVAALEQAALHVGQQVLLQPAGLGEALPALAALVVAAPLRAAVAELVQRGGEAVPALDAEVGGVAALAEPVAGQQGGGPEGPAALGAVVGLQPAVDPPVLHQDGVVLETLVALGAPVDPRRLLPPAGGRRDVGPFGGFGKVGGGGRVGGQLLVEHDDLGDLAVFVVAIARVGSDGHLQGWREGQGGDQEIVRLKVSCRGRTAERKMNKKPHVWNSSTVLNTHKHTDGGLCQLPVALLALEEEFKVVPV